MVTDLCCKCSLVGIGQVICLWLWKLRRLPGLTSLFEEGLAGAGCPGLSTVVFENLHWWRFHSLSGQCHCLVTLTVYSFFLCLNRISCISFGVCHILSHHWASLRQSGSAFVTPTHPNQIFLPGHWTGQSLGLAIQSYLSRFAPWHLNPQGICC